MAFEVAMPKFGQTMEEGTIAEWVKHVGSYVAKGDLLVRIETDKAILDVFAEESGYLLELTAMEGEVVPCGRVIALMGNEL